MVGTSTETALLEPVEKAKKKLSFREPEIMGYYMMQMKQGVADRLSKRGKSKNAAAKTASSPTKNRTFVNHRSSLADDDEPHDKMHDSSSYGDVIALADSAEDLTLDVRS